MCVAVWALCGTQCAAGVVGACLSNNTSQHTPIQLGSQVDLLQMLGNAALEASAVQSPDRLSQAHWESSEEDPSLLEYSGHWKQALSMR